MIRQHLFDKRAPADPLFRWRGGEVSRIEGLADAVFAFSLTLIVVSLEVPRTYEDLMLVIRSFPAFAICFSLLVMFWYYHYKFFRRFGLEDFPTILLNTLLLFVVLFYVYPLKFLFTRLINPLVGVSNSPIRGTEMQHLMAFYGLGVVLIFGIFAWMNFRGYRLRAELELDELEVFLTRSEIQGHLLSAGIGLLSMAIALLGGPGSAAWAGLIYFLMGPLHGLRGYREQSRAQAIQNRLS